MVTIWLALLGSHIHHVVLPGMAVVMMCPFEPLLGPCAHLDVPSGLLTCPHMMWNLGLIQFGVYFCDLALALSWMNPARVGILPF